MSDVIVYTFYFAPLGISVKSVKVAPHTRVSTYAKVTAFGFSETSAKRNTSVFARGYRGIHRKARSPSHCFKALSPESRRSDIKSSKAAHAFSFCAFRTFPLLPFRDHPIHWHYAIRHTVGFEPTLLELARLQCDRYSRNTPWNILAYRGEKNTRRTSLQAYFTIGFLPISRKKSCELKKFAAKSKYFFT